MASFPALLREMRDIDRATLQPPNDHHIGSEFDFTVNFDDNPSDSCPSLDFSTEDFQCNLDFLNESYLLDPSYNTNSTPRTTLLSKLQALKEELRILGGHLAANIADGSAATESPSISHDSPIPTALHFTNWRVTVAYSCFWSLLILTNKLIMKLLQPYDSTYYGLEAESRTVALEICKTWEDAWASKPIGAFHTGLSFVMAYEFCTPDVQEWILRGLNGLLDHQAVDTFRWSDRMMATMSGKLAGEGPDLVFTHANVSK